MDTQHSPADTAPGTSGRGLQYISYEANSWAAKFTKSGTHGRPQCTNESTRYMYTFLLECCLSYANAPKRSLGCMMRLHSHTVCGIEPCRGVLLSCLFVECAKGLSLGARVGIRKQAGDFWLCTGVNILVDPWLVEELVFAGQSWLYRGRKTHIAAPDLNKVVEGLDALILSQVCSCCAPPSLPVMQYM